MTPRLVPMLLQMPVLASGQISIVVSIKLGKHLLFQYAFSSKILVCCQTSSAFGIVVGKVAIVVIVIG